MKHTAFELCVLIAIICHSVLLSVIVVPNPRHSPISSFIAGTSLGAAMMAGYVYLSQ
ncbi:hypothetical protein DEEACLCL_00173 [Salmonella phage CRW-SP2]|nr:hypothetical protein DEEACLCL_00173 [Salmonella phage CRW-SP2]